MSDALSLNSTSSIPNNGTTSPISTLPSPSQLSWQSALWALIAIALNTMTQSSPSSNSLFIDPFSLLRASPIVCIADLLVMLLWLLRLTLFSRPRLSFLKAVQCFRKETGLEKKKERVSILTIVLFVLGPLPQFIKLNACSGIPWTLTWSWMYMLCYLFTTISIVCDRGGTEGHHLPRAGTTLSDDTKVSLNKNAFWIYVLAYAAQLISSAWLARVFIDANILHKIAGKIYGTLVSIYWALLIPAGAMGVIIGIHGCLKGCWGCMRRLHEGWGWLCFASLLTANIYGLSHLSPSTLDPSYWAPTPFSASSNALVCLFIYLVSVYGLYFLGYLTERFGPNYEISLHHLPNRRPAPGSPPLVTQPSADLVKDQSGNASYQFFFASTMLVFALVYYWRVYDPSDTVKPGWLDVLG